MNTLSQSSNEQLQHFPVVDVSKASNVQFAESTPQDIYPEGSPEAIIEAHADSVRRNGDAYQQLGTRLRSPDLLRTANWARAGAMGVTASFTIQDTLLETSGFSSTKAVSALYFVGIGASVIKERFGQKRSNLDDFDQEVETLQHAARIPVEFYSYGNGPSKRVGVRLYASDQPASPTVRTAELLRLRHVAMVADASQVTLPYSKLGKVEFDAEPITITQGADNLSASENIRDEKEDLGGKFQDQQLVRLSIDELDSIVEQTVEATRADTQYKIMQIIARSQPRHPAVLAYEYLAKHPDTPRTTFRQVLTESITRRNDEVDVEIYQPETTLGMSAVKLRRKVHLSGMPAISDGKPVVNWRRTTNNLHVDTTEMLGRNETAEGLTEKLFSGKIPSSQLVEKCEILAWLVENGQLDNTELQASQIVDVEVPMQEGLQQRTVRALTSTSAEQEQLHIDKRPDRMRQIRKAALPLLMVAGLGAGTTAAKTHVEGILKLVTGGDTETTGSSSSQVGNAAEKDNQPIWKTESINGMPSDGYWFEETNDHLSNEDGEIVWEESLYEKLDEVHDLALPENLDPDLPVLKVSSGDISQPTKYSTKENPATGKTEHRIRKEVPVLEGTRIVAATAAKGNVPLHLGIDLDGQQSVIAYTDTDPGNITYWLAETDDAPMIKRTPNGEYDKATEEVVNKAWEAYLGRKLPTNIFKRLALQENVLQNNFEYALSPFADDKSLADLGALVVGALDIEKANCNIASTVLAASNPHLILPVTGFRNSTNAEQRQSGVGYLSTDESHMWTIDADGVKHDPTPSGPVPEGFGVEDFGTRDPGHSALADNAKNIGLSAVSAGALMLAYRRRRKIVHGMLATSARVNNASLSLIPESRVIAAHTGLNHRAYASSPMSYVRNENTTSLENARASFDWYAQTNSSTKPFPKTGNRKLDRDAARANRIIRTKQTLARRTA